MEPQHQNYWQRRRADAWLHSPLVLANLSDSLCGCLDCQDWLDRHQHAVWRSLDFSVAGLFEK